MKLIKNDLTAEIVSGLAKRHTWAATGVSDYPPHDPLVGQSRFFRRYRTFIHTVDHEADHFAHVFAVEAEWGRGKSRLAHELVAQINDCSKGWYVRGPDGKLENQQLFDQAGQDRYLALYIRYSQVASDYENSDNWFGFGLYKALLPLATRRFDGSIQSKIAEQALRRLQPMGFDPDTLAAKLALGEAHSDETLYEDPALVVRLVQSAYAYLQQFGIAYVMVVLDELETVAETATFGLEQDDTKRLDGQAIRLIGKAIKEEDPRRKLPWLRYVALCSPLLGQQLREIQSVARRFELVELEHNAFADVADYVRQLKAERKLAFDYPNGLVEAAYAMSGANFGWFNVIMANVDAVLAQFEQAGRAMPPLGDLFEAVVESSGRVAAHVLDAAAITSIKSGDQALLAAARALLYGQLPVSLKHCPARCAELLQVQNEDGEPVASLYQKIPFDARLCRLALEEGKFQRIQDEWQYPSVEQTLSLSILLQNLHTFAVNETALAGADAQDCLLIPLAHGEFRHLLGLLYDHPAVEYAADALWQKLIGEQRQLPDDEATHIGPSVAMLLRLDLRYRSQQHNSMIFRDPAHADGHAAAMKRFLHDGGKNPALRFQVRLTGLFRLLDKNWQYAQSPLANKEGLSIQLAPRGQGQGQRGGLVVCEALKLHPENQAWFAWVSKREEFDRLHKLVGLRGNGDERVPVMAFTASTHLMEQYTRGDIDDTVRDDLLLYYLNPSEIDQIERIGLLPEYCQGFALDDAALTSKFKGKLNAMREFAYQAMHKWRARLNARGLIAWPLRPTAKLGAADRDLLFKAWKLLAIDEPALTGLRDIEPRHGIGADEVAALLPRVGLSSRILAQGFSANEHAGLFADLANPMQAQARLPVFLAAIANPAKNQQWTLARARRDWYWGYLSQAPGLSAKSVFEDWMWWCGALHLMQLEDATSAQAKWVSTPRAAFDNAITEAKNWLEGGTADGYAATVGKLERVFGLGLIRDKFAHLGAPTAGTETVKADVQLQAARKRFQQLKNDEEGLVGEETLGAIAEKLPLLLQGRAEILARVDKVKPLIRQVASLGNLHTLRLEDDMVSLHHRIEQARLFTEYVDKAAKQISQRINTLMGDIEADCAAVPAFPKSLFTFSLQTVLNILDGVLKQPNDSATSKMEESGLSDTLSFYLRSLQFDKAAERLRLLAEEAGVNIDAGSQQSLLEIGGHVLSAYRMFKEKHMNFTDYLGELKSRCASMQRMLDPLPADYAETRHLQELSELRQKFIEIDDAFDNLGDDAKEARENFRGSAQKGQFSAIRDVTERLLKGVTSRAHVAGGTLLRVENALAEYRSKKVTEFNALLPQTLAPLFAACHIDPPLPLRIDQIKDLSLLDLQMQLDAQTTKWEGQANQLLADTGLDVAAWNTLALAIADARSASIDAATQDRLVAKGILKVQLTFGAGK